MTMKSKEAFTLIELLVVIAIIAILAAILFPVFAQAKESAKQTQCIMQFKQIAAGHLLYLGDHDDTWAPIMNQTRTGPEFPNTQPWIGYDTRNGGGGGGFYGDIRKRATRPIQPGKIDSYLKNFEVRQCPKRPDGSQMVLAYGYWHGCKVASECTQYGGNWSRYWNRNSKAIGNEYSVGSKYYYNLRGVGMTAEAVNDSEIEESSNTIIMWEHGASIPVCVFLFPPDWFETPPNDPSLIDHFHFLHRSAAITAWADGHAKRMTYSSLKRPMFSVQKSIYY